MSKIAKMPKRVTLSINKVTKLLADNGYILAGLYCIENEVIFLECRTPKLQRTFIIHVPEKYLLVRGDATHKVVEISHVAPSPSRQLDYLMEIKGPLLECDLVAFSSARVCLYRNNGTSDCFKFGGPDADDDEGGLSDDEGQDGQNPDVLLKGVNVLLKKLQGEDAQVELPTADIDNPDAKELKPEDIEEMKIVDPAATLSQEKGTSNEPIVELEFEEETRNEVPALGEGDHEAVEGDSDEEGDEGKDYTSNTNMSSLSYRKDNSLPSDISDAEISIGIIYWCVDLASFYKKAAALEAEVLSAYDVLDANEMEMRESKIHIISELCTKLAARSVEILDSYKKRENELKAERLKLSAILDSAEGLKLKTLADTKKYADVKSDIDRIHTQTKTTLYETNIGILRLRDEVDDALDGFQRVMEEMLETE